MNERREARAVTRLKLRAGQEIVNARLELKVLRNGRANRRARGNGTAARLIIEMGREVTLDAEMLTEVPDHRSFKPGLGGVVSSDAAIGAKANAATIGFAKSAVPDEDFDLGIIVLIRLLRRNERGRAHQQYGTAR